MGTGDVSGYGRLVRRKPQRDNTPRPYGGYFDELVDELALALGDEFGYAIERVVVYAGQLTLHVARGLLLVVARALRDVPALRFELCCGVSGVHYPDDAGRELHAFYPLMSITHNRRVQLEVACRD
ncbi:NADH-quinone oxidoreductase subunit C, partial [Mycolicibacterium vinylchloridicum]|uniref:NADH-quinone oxidoreductase subunit C n=1 Tax=Mycolicibacterium vinylchloridicum TaxID=2736928 RepID=UPI0015CD8F61